MSEADIYDRKEPVRTDPARSEVGRSNLDARHPSAPPPGRMTGSPLPAGNSGLPSVGSSLPTGSLGLPTGGSASPSAGSPAGPLGLQASTSGRPLQGPSGAHSGKTPPGRALAVHGQQEEEHSAAVQWAIAAIKQAIPFVQRLLPLIDTNVPASVTHMVTSHEHHPAPPVDLVPIEHGLAELQTQHDELSGLVHDQNTSLKRVEDQLDMVREATDRNTLEQQELIEDLKAIGNKVNLFALLVLALLIVSLLLNLFLFLHVQRVLP